MSAHGAAGRLISTSLLTDVFVRRGSTFWKAEVIAGIRLPGYLIRDRNRPGVMPNRVENVFVKCA